MLTISCKINWKEKSVSVLFHHKSGDWWSLVFGLVELVLSSVTESKSLILPLCFPHSGICQDCLLVIRQLSQILLSCTQERLNKVVWFSVWLVLFWGKVPEGQVSLCSLICSGTHYIDLKFIEIHRNLLDSASRMLLFSNLSTFKGKTVVEAHLLADFEKYLIYSFISGYH